MLFDGKVSLLIMTLILNVILNLMLILNLVTMATEIAELWTPHVAFLGGRLLWNV